jgi:hypothetical protein
MQTPRAYRASDGRGVDSEVVTFFHLVDGKISESYAMTRPVSGNDADRDVHTARYAHLDNGGSATSQY